MFSEANANKLTLSENVNIFNYNNNKTIQAEKENKEQQKNSITKAASTIRLFSNSIFESEENNFLQQSQNNKNLLSDNDQTQKTKLRFLQKFNCLNSTLSCSGHGECSQDKKDCICESAYASLINPKDPASEDKRCNYERKSQLKAFLFELFLGFGAGHFYTERYTMASLKLTAFIFGIFIICLFPITAKFLSEKLESDCLVLSVSCFYYLCSIGLAFWFIYDLVTFGLNKYLDGNQIQLLSWSKNPDMQQH